MPRVKEEADINVAKPKPRRRRPSESKGKTGGKTNGSADVVELAKNTAARQGSRFNNIQTILIELLRKIRSKCDKYGTFCAPVEPKQFPDYYSVINKDTEAMDLKTIERLIMDNTCDSYIKFEDLFNRIVFCCEKYNTNPRCEIRNELSEMQTLAKPHLESCRKKFERIGIPSVRKSIKMSSAPDMDSQKIKPVLDDKCLFDTDSSDGDSDSEDESDNEPLESLRSVKLELPPDSKLKNVIPAIGMKVDIVDSCQTVNLGIISSITQSKDGISVSYHYQGWSVHYDDAINLVWPCKRVSTAYTYTRVCKAILALDENNILTCDKWPVQVYFRVPMPGSKSGTNELRMEGRIFMKPYSPNSMSSGDRKRLLDIDKGSWRSSSQLLKWGSEYRGGMKGFEEALKEANEDAGTPELLVSNPCMPGTALIKPEFDAEGKALFSKIIRNKVQKLPIVNGSNESGYDDFPSNNTDSSKSEDSLNMNNTFSIPKKSDILKQITSDEPDEKLSNCPSKSDFFSFAGVKLSKVRRASSSDLKPHRNKKRKITPDEIAKAVRMQNAAASSSTRDRALAARAPQANDLMGLALGKKAKKHTLGADWLKIKQRRGIKVTKISDEQKSDEEGREEKKQLNVGTSEKKPKNKGDDGSNSSSAEALTSFESYFDVPRIPVVPPKKQGVAHGDVSLSSPQTEHLKKRRAVSNGGNVGDVEPSLESDYDLVGRMLADEEKSDKVAHDIGNPSDSQKGKPGSDLLKRKRIKEILLRKKEANYSLNEQESREYQVVSWKDENSKGRSNASDLVIRNEVLASSESSLQAESNEKKYRPELSTPVGSITPLPINPAHSGLSAVAGMPVLPTTTILTAKKILEDHGWIFEKLDSEQKIASISRDGSDCNVSESSRRSGASAHGKVRDEDRPSGFEKIQCSKAEINTKSDHETKALGVLGESRSLGTNNHGDAVVSQRSTLSGEATQRSKETSRIESPLEGKDKAQSRWGPKRTRFITAPCARGDSTSMQSELDIHGEKLNTFVSHIQSNEIVGRSSFNANLMKVDIVSGVGRGKLMTMPAWQTRTEASKNKISSSSARVVPREEITKPAWQLKAGASRSIQRPSVVKASHTPLSSSGVGRGTHMTKPAWQTRAEARKNEISISSARVVPREETTEPTWQLKAEASRSIDKPSVVKDIHMRLSFSGVERGKDITEPAWLSKAATIGSASLVNGRNEVPFSSARFVPREEITKPVWQSKAIEKHSIVKASHTPLSSSGVGRGRHMTKPAWQSNAANPGSAPSRRDEIKSAGRTGAENVESLSFRNDQSKRSDRIINARSSTDSGDEFGRSRQSITQQTKDHRQGSRTSTPTKPSSSRFGREPKKKMVLCRFFFSQKGCKRGKTCHFSHEKKTQDGNVQFSSNNKNVVNGSAGDNCASPDMEWLQHEDPDNPKIRIRDVHRRAHRTILLKNLPREYTRPMLLDELESCGFTTNDAIDCIHLPENDVENFGYAIIHLKISFQVVKLLEKFDRRRWDNFYAQKRAEVTYAAPHIQGRKALVSVFGSRVVVSDVDVNEEEDTCTHIGHIKKFSSDSRERSPDRRFDRRNTDVRR